METLFILDTNVYRNLATNKRLCEMPPTANEMRIAERKLDSRSLLSVTVAMELMRHLDKADPAFDVCYKALVLQFHHTQKRPGSPNNSIDFIPPLEEILSRFFFRTGSPLFSAYRAVIDTMESVVENLEEDNVDQYTKNLNAIGSQILHEKTGIRDNFEDFIKSYTGGLADWSFFKKDKTVKPRLLKDIQSGRLLSVFTIGMLNRVHSSRGEAFDHENIDPQFDIPLQEFRIYFEPFLILLQTLFSKMLHGVIAMSDVRDIRWNTYNDIQILAAACYATYRDKDKDVRVVLVSDDGGIHEACKGTYMESNVWTRSQYLSYIF